MIFGFFFRPASEHFLKNSRKPEYKKGVALPFDFVLYSVFGLVVCCMHVCN